MFKKISHIIVSLLLLSATIGMAVSRHYCAGELVNISIYSSDEGCCSEGDCCKNESHFYQVKDSFAQPEASFVPASSIVNLLAGVFRQVTGFTADSSDDILPAKFESTPVLPLQTAIAVRQVFLL